jgi:hypothetical protein
MRGTPHAARRAPAQLGYGPRNLIAIGRGGGSNVIAKENI